MKVLVMMGSASDKETMQKAADTLANFGVETDVKILSAHRCADEVIALAKSAKSLGYGVIIAGAGMAAHLAGVVAGNTTLPVIGVPLYSKWFQGLDALYSVVQMPKGVPVATVAVDGSVNAAILAVQILAVYDADLAAKLADYKETMKNDVLELNK